MIRIKEAIIVEGRYDVNTVKQLVDTIVLETGGFRIFSDKERLSMFRQLSKKRGLLILTDSDGAGLVIRNYLKGSIPASQVKHAYIPEIFGKEPRKRTASKEGKLGVEGMKPDVLREALRRAGATILDDTSGEETGKCTEHAQRAISPIKKADLYVLGLSGQPGSEKLRTQVLRELGLPTTLSANALIEFLNVISNRDELAALVEEIRKK